MKTKKRSIWPVITAGTIGTVLLLSLGAWQIARLSEKQAQIASLEARLIAEPILMSELLQRYERDEDIEFVRVKLSGQLDHTSERLKLSTNKGGAAWQVLTPLLTDDGIFVLLDRGLVPENQRDPISRSADARVVDLPAIARLHANGQGAFDPENDVAGNQWFWWDIPAMLSSVSIPLDAKVTPFILQRLPAENEQGLPEAVQPKASLRNNHLGYAITWFGLALVAALMTGVYATSLNRKA